MSKIDQPGETIKTFYQLEIMRALKARDKKSVGDFVTVELVGGRVKFDDGTTAEIRTPVSEVWKMARPMSFS